MMDFTVPSKVFLLGEYRVLLGESALVATLSPRFGWSRSCEGGSGEIGSDILTDRTIHSESPAGLLRRWFERRGHAHRARDTGVWHDPHRGAGGFGASTAEFALCFEGWGAHRIDPELGRLPRWQAMWRLYRELLQEANQRGAPLPSGADVAAQVHGGVVEFSFSRQMGEWGESRKTGGERAQIRGLNTPHALPILVFSATAGDARKKVATHDHLAELSEENLRGKLRDPEFSASFDSGLQAMESEDWNRLGAAFSRYGDALHRVGLESESTREIRAELTRGATGLLGVKGSGAMQADLILAVVDPKIPGASAAIANRAEALGLVLVQNGLSQSEPGLTCHED